MPDHRNTIIVITSVNVICSIFTQYLFLIRWFDIAILYTLLQILFPTTSRLLCLFYKPACHVKRNFLIPILLAVFLLYNRDCK